MNLKAAFELINSAKVATECFQKSRSWLHQRVNGSVVNGKPAELTEAQIRQLAVYLRWKAQELLDVADSLDRS